MQQFSGLRSPGGFQGTHGVQETEPRLTVSKASI